MPRRNLAGLDSLRFVAALFVLFSHSPVFPFRFVLGPSVFAAQLSSAYELMFNGVAAVLVFFTLSGVCNRQRMMFLHRCQRPSSSLPAMLDTAFETGLPPWKPL